MSNECQVSAAAATTDCGGLLSNVLEVFARAGTLKSSAVCKRPLRVLVADDNRDAADSLALLVKIWGHEVWTVYDGGAALETASVCHPDVVLLDITMPVKGGCEVARLLRPQSWFDGSLLIAVTGWANQSHRQLGEAAGFDHYLIKPLDPSSLELLLARQRVQLAETVSLGTSP